MTRSTTTLATILLALPPAALAQTLTTGAQPTPTTTLDEIVLIATGMETEVLKSPSSVSVITADAIARKGARSVGDLLADVPGVFVEEQGIERIRIRGESSRRVAILLDGQKLTDHTGYGQPVLIDPGSIERIEVVRGASSVIAGTQAIGGVVNIVSKKGADEPFVGEFGLTGFSATGGYRATLGLSGQQGDFDWRLGLGKSRQGDRETPDGTLAESDTNDESANLHLGYRSGNHYFGAGLQAFDLASNVYTGDPNFTIALPKRDLRKQSLFYEGTDLAPWLSLLRADVHRQTIDRDFTNDVNVAMGPGRGMRILSGSVDEQLTWGASLKAEMGFAANQRTIVGLEYEDDGLVTDKTTRTTMTGMGPFPITTTRVGHDDASVRTWSLYGQHEVDFTPTLTGTFGARWYHVEAELNDSVANGVAQPLRDTSDSRVLGSAGLVWSPDEDTSLRANISQGYIYPTLAQLFLTTTGGGGPIVGNPDLQPERSITYELGARTDRGPLTLDATAFYSASRDYIAMVGVDERTSTYQNVNEARSFGVELAAEYRTALGYTPYVSAAWIRRKFEFANGFTTYDSGNPDLSGRLGVRKDFTMPGGILTADLFLRGESGAVSRSASGAIGDEAAGWTTINLRGEYAMDNGAVISAELGNIGNRRYHPIDQYPAAERNLVISTNFRF